MAECIGFSMSTLHELSHLFPQYWRLGLKQAGEKKMTAQATETDVNDILDEVVRLHRHPGGIAMILREGEVIGERAWGFADMEGEKPMTMHTQFPICSITKQMLGMLVWSLREDPTSKMHSEMEARGTNPDGLFNAELRTLLRNLPEKHDLTISQLCNMQSGLRDYWAEYGL